MLGKRKREHAAVPRNALHEHSIIEPGGNPDVPDVFRKYFEEQFEPLPELPSLQQPLHADEDGSEESEPESTDWNGISETETGVDAVEIIEHETIQTFSSESGETSEGKYFMVRNFRIRARTGS